MRQAGEGRGGRLVLRVALGLLLIALLAAGWLYRTYQGFLETPLAVADEGLVFEVRRGQSLKGVARALAAQGVLERPRFLVWLGISRGVAGRIQAGEYRIEPGTRPGDLLQRLVDGKVLLHPLTIVEGWTFAQMRAHLARQPFLRHTLEGASPEVVMQRIGRPGIHPEGRFLPDTYHFPRGTSDVECLKRAYAAMESFLAEAWAERDPGLPLETPYEALILASIIEKETAVPEERPLIAGVFVRRLQRGMRLQTDPTVIYGLGEAFDGNIRYRDLRRDTPYNTYTRKGLPPTPIALPGREAILAALHPAPGDALYFVARGDGTHEFSATLDAHNRAVRKYQLKRR